MQKKVLKEKKTSQKPFVFGWFLAQCGKNAFWGKARALFNLFQLVG